MGKYSILMRKIPKGKALNTYQRVKMSPIWRKKQYEAKAILRKRRNIKPGIETRTLILKQIRHEPKTVGEIAKNLNMSYGRVLIQLKSMNKEGIVDRTKRKPHYWYLTGFGQQVLA